MSKAKTPPATPPTPPPPGWELQYLMGSINHLQDCMSAMLSRLDRIQRLSNIAAAAATAEADERPKLREKLRLLIETDGARLSERHASKFGDMTIGDCLQRLEAQKKRGKR